MNVEPEKVGSVTGYYKAFFSVDHSCHMTCKDDDRCMASSYLAADTEADKPLCFLYGDISELQPLDGTVTGSSVATKHCVEGKRVTEEQIRWVFDDNLEIIFLISP